MDINDLATAINSKCSFTPSLIRQIPDAPKFYTFIHIQKCAGIDFELPYKAALKYHCKMNNKFSYTSRADDEGTFKNIITSFQEIQTKSYNCNQMHGILASHLGIKRLFKEKIVPKDHVITILRPPIERLLSLFSYNCMRANRLPELDEFMDFISQPDNINKICFSLDTEEDSPVDTLENKIRESFFACIDVGRSKFLLGELLGRNHLPNVLKENINQTLPDFKLKKEDLPDSSLKKISRLNAKDLDLYQRFKTVPLEPEILITGKINFETLLISDNQTQERSKSSSIVIKTDPILIFLQKNRATLPNRLGTIINHLIKKENAAMTS